MRVFLIAALLVTHLNARSQFRSPSTDHYYFNYSILPGSEKTFIHGLLADPVQNHRQSPMLTYLPQAEGKSQNNFFWAGTVTTMSFNKGKFGTLYYWDVHGDLQGTRGFIDISGKHRRGVKLVFPWRKF